MVRLTRREQQTRTRAAVLTAAGQEFADRGYAEAKVDRIADRAELTRGAVYSNFPSKRALYLAVLLEAATPVDQADDAPESIAAAVEAFTRVRLERLPLAVDEPAPSRLAALSLTGVFDDEAGRATLAQLTRLEALLLAVALESLRARDPGRRVRLAELILTLLHGATGLAETAPGFGDPFDVARACRHLAGLDLADTWDPPYLPFVAPARTGREPWSPPAELTDELTGRPVGFAPDGLLVVLGTDRLEAAEEAVRAGDEPATIAVVTDDPAETGALVRLRITDLTTSLRRVFGPSIRPSLRLVLDDRGALATAIGAAAARSTESAVRIEGGAIVARADGRGAAYAAARATR